MILRKNSINPEAREVSLVISFSPVDAWAWLSYFGWLFHRNDEREFGFALSLVHTEENLVRWLSLDKNALGWMPKKHATPVAKWAVATAVRQGYLAKVEGGYRLTERMLKKNGRPREKE